MCITENTGGSSAVKGVTNLISATNKGETAISLLFYPSLVGCGPERGRLVKRSLSMNAGVTLLIISGSMM